MVKRKVYLFKWFLLATVGLLTFGFFYSAPPPFDRILNIQNYLITVSGIISGIMIAYLATKLFNLKQERGIRQLEINKLSEKLTSYRRVLYYVMKSRTFWNAYKDIEVFKYKYPGLDFGRLHNQSEEPEELVTKFYLEDKTLSKTTIVLYMAMEEIFGVEEQGIMSWTYDRTVKFYYPLEELYKFQMPSNQIWYYLEGRYSKHTEGLINDTAIWELMKKK